MDQEKFGNIIKEIRKKNNLTRKQLADKYNILIIILIVVGLIIFFGIWQREDKNLSSGKTDANLENVKYDENKVNIYFFWGDGCPHCEAEHEFFAEIENEYGQYYNLNTFEVWYNEDNLNILKQFSAKMGDKIGGVPYTIIGNKTFSGFGEKAKEQIKDAIKTQYKNSYDVYFDNEN